MFFARSPPNFRAMLCVLCQPEISAASYAELADGNIYQLYLFWVFDWWTLGTTSALGESWACFLVNFGLVHYRQTQGFVDWGIHCVYQCISLLCYSDVRVILYISASLFSCRCLLKWSIADELCDAYSLYQPAFSAGVHKGAIVATKTLYLTDCGKNRRRCTSVIRMRLVCGSWNSQPPVLVWW